MTSRPAGSPISTAIRDTITELRDQVCRLHAELPRNQLVIWTAGNVSARVPGHDLLVIKPSGVSYDELTAESMVVTDFDGTLGEGVRASSSDTLPHTAQNFTPSRTLPSTDVSRSMSGGSTDNR